MSDLKQEFLTQFEQRIDRQFAAINQKMDQQFAAINQKMDQQFAAINQKMDQQFAAVNQQYTEITQKTSDLSGDIKALTSGWKT